MLKRSYAALAALFLLSGPAIASGTLPGISMSQQLGTDGKPLNGGRLYLIQAGTTSTPQNCYQDGALTIPHPNPITLNAAGRVPQLFCADGSIKVRLTNAAGVEQLVADNLLVVGPSGGGGGGGSVDPTTILATGDFKQVYNTGVLTGFVRCNGRTIGSATSGATERANADTAALFSFLWGADPNLAVSGGRGANAAADYAANKALTLPDCRGRVLAGLDDMGSTAANRLSTTYYGTASTVLGAGSLTSDNRALATTNLPPYTPSGVVSTGLNNHNILAFTAGGTNVGFGGVATGGQSIALFGNQTVSSTFFGSPQGGVSTPFGVVQPTMVMTIYIKL